ncbi:hypothetical protein H257_07002 [Aphanomyces astaci]|uniref:Uncharacterized protein n=1 Tax=Aphanomyces astaci TaxID=112090 RepID=W4GJA4_APHAT|nr:hypothetical protein H257_07002 [Aphanomyces astaci]ETV79777.1 hypothetical protein H257_07002 [Aphanomyces astaci]|eukprot:XP_009830713.1 hypothetical protein H257_07002 [Aphanomyces astaci]
MADDDTPTEAPFGGGGLAAVSYFSSSYWVGFLIMVSGVVVPLAYMFVQNKKAFKSVRRD